MCYAIPGKITQINDNIVTVDYFGEIKKARNEFYQLSIGDYIYAQGGFVIQRISETEAAPILKTWEELFPKLKEIDLRITHRPKNLYQTANSIRQRRLGNACCIHGIIEFSNYCRNSCFYCGIRNENIGLPRYRMGIEEIADACGYAVGELAFKALVLQSGEDPWYTQERLTDTINKIRAKCAALLALSIGERDIGTYEKLFQAGARAVLLRFETGNSRLYEKYRPGHTLQDRVSLIKQLRGIGYLVMTGFLIGLPGQTEQELLDDIELSASLGAEMFSFGPFIPHPQTPLSGAASVPGELVLKTIARARIMYPDAKILATTALEALDGKDGVRQALLSGANSLMINVTPKRYQPLYEIYPNRPGIEGDIRTRIESLISLLHSIGRAPADLGM